MKKESFFKTFGKKMLAWSPLLILGGLGVWALSTSWATVGIADFLATLGIKFGHSTLANMVGITTALTEAGPLGNAVKAVVHVGQVAIPVLTGGLYAWGVARGTAKERSRQAEREEIASSVAKSLTAQEEERDLAARKIAREKTGTKKGTRTPEKTGPTHAA